MRRRFTLKPSARQSSIIKEKIVQSSVKVSPSGWEFAYKKYRWQHYRQAGMVFCHIPKNAGSTFAIETYGRRLGHIRASQLRDEMSTGNYLPIVAILRDPVDRFMSAYRYAKSGGSGDGIIRNPEQYSGVDSPAEFIERFVSVDEYERDPVFRSQSYYLDLDPEQIDRDALIILDQENLDAVRHVPMLAHLGVVAEVRRNQSTGSSLLDDRDVRLIEEAYSEDMRLRERFQKFLVQEPSS